MGTCINLLFYPICYFLKLIFSLYKVALAELPNLPPSPPPPKEWGQGEIVFKMHNTSKRIIHLLVVPIYLININGMHPFFLVIYINCLRILINFRHTVYKNILGIPTWL